MCLMPFHYQVKCLMTDQGRLNLMKYFRLLMMSSRQELSKDCLKRRGRQLVKSRMAMRTALSLMEEVQSGESV